MRSKAISDLANLSDNEFFEQISTGYKHVLENAIKISDDSSLLSKQERPNGCRILSGVAEEEAAKCLILIDAVRCPRKPPETLTTHLRRFNDHLAKGLYAEACYWSPTDFNELIGYIDNERLQYYLDGPNDIDWIFSNRILTNREWIIYVDYVAHEEEGVREIHAWQIPDNSKFLLPDMPLSLMLAKAFFDTGCTTPEALALIADFWRPIVMTPNFSWVDLRELNYKMLKKLIEKRLIIAQPQKVYTTIFDIWTFPLHSSDLKLKEIKKAELREIQKKWPHDI